MYDMTLCVCVCSPCTPYHVSGCFPVSKSFLWFKLCAWNTIITPGTWQTNKLIELLSLSHTHTHTHSHALSLSFRNRKKYEVIEIQTLPTVYVPLPPVSISRADSDPHALSKFNWTTAAGTRFGAPRIRQLLATAGAAHVHMCVCTVGRVVTFLWRG